MKRRSFLRHTTHSIALPGIISSLGLSMPGSQALAKALRQASENDQILVMIYLEGGNDGLNTVIPLDQLSTLNKVRPHVMLPDSSILELGGTGVGLHPSLTGFKSLFDEDRLSVIQSVGYPDQDYSHFRSTDIWMSASDSDELVNTGWAGRLMNERFPEYPNDFPNENAPHPLAIEIGRGASLLFQGPSASMSMVISDPSSFYRLVDNIEQEAPDTSAGDKLRYVRLIARQSQLYGKVVTEAAEKVTQQTDYPEDNELAQQLKIVSRLIKGGIQTPLYLVRIGSFDTHDEQVLANDHTKGEHSDLLKAVDDAVSSFMKDLEFQGTDDRVIGMTFSEFGRRIVSNASLGTDHGSAAPMFIFGNKVQPGIIGNNPAIPFNADYSDNLEMQHDFRQVYASLMGQWLNAETSTNTSVLFKDFDPLELIAKEEQITSLFKEKNEPSFKVYPNPLNGQGNIDFTSKGGSTSIKLIDNQGRTVQNIFNGSIPSGPQHLSWATHSLRRGHYFILIEQESGRMARAVMKID